MCIRDRNTPSFPATGDPVDPSEQFRHLNVKVGFHGHPETAGLLYKINDKLIVVFESFNQIYINNILNLNLPNSVSDLCHAIPRQQKAYNAYQCESLLFVIKNKFKASLFV